MLRKLAWGILLLVGLLLMGVVLYQLPPVQARLGWRVANLQAQLYYRLNPPEEAVFVPQEHTALIESIVQATLSALPTATPFPTATLQSPPDQAAGPTATPPSSPTPTLSPTPLPDQVLLSGLTHEYQKMNNCGPATLAMLLSYWGWEGDQTDTRAVLRPNHAEYDDKNVMPAELAAYVKAHTGLEALVRVGGDLETLKRLLAAGFPVMVEKGFQPPKEAWMGHFEVLNGYDDARERFITQDSYIMPDFPVPYGELSERWWRDFNYVYLVAYPPEREAELLGLLGADADPRANSARAAERALTETEFLSGRDLYFAWFNYGASLTALGNYPGAAAAFDQAFQVYANLAEDERPWRLLWYRDEPYAAYYHTGRYQDVVNLASTTLSFLSQPLLEETLYWRGMAKAALGDFEGAIHDLQRAARVNPDSTPARLELERLGAALEG